ncbi:hypothetical protein B0H14DRAFT_2632035 [Mycena olivaceomarginata]|nr:hypothetical protein B0H14DRAFT_2632035 [Mycena olivaceomarginata]
MCANRGKICTLMHTRAATNPDSDGLRLHRVERSCTDGYQHVENERRKPTRIRHLAAMQGETDTRRIPVRRLRNAREDSAASSVECQVQRASRYGEDQSLEAVVADWNSGTITVKHRRKARDVNFRSTLCDGRNCGTKPTPARLKRMGLKNMLEKELSRINCGHSRLSFALACSLRGLKEYPERT